MHVQLIKNQDMCSYEIAERFLTMGWIWQLKRLFILCFKIRKEELVTSYIKATLDLLENIILLPNKEKDIYFI